MAVLEVPLGGPVFTLVQRKRATNLFEDGQVEIVGKAKKASANYAVQDKQAWAVSLKGPEDDWTGTCTCPAGEKGDTCQHILAAAWTRWKPDSDDSNAPWRKAIAAAETALAKAPLLGKKGAATSQLVLVILAREVGDLLVELRAQSRRKDGQWGSPRRLPVDHERFFAELDSVDQSLLQRLEGVRAPHEARLLQAGTTGLAMHPNLAAELLPAFGRESRLGFEEDSGGRVLDVETDRSEEPWEHAFRIDAEGREVVLETFLRRGDEARDLDEEDRLFTGFPLALLGGKLHRRQIAPEIEELVAAARAGNVRAPKSQSSSLIAAIAAIAGESLSEAPGVRWDDDGESPRPLLFVSGMAEGKSSAYMLDCRVACVYGTQEASLFQAGPKAVLTDDGRLLKRDRTAETALFQHFLLGGGEPEEGLSEALRVETTRNGGVRQGIFPRLVRRLHSAGWVILANGVVLRSPSRWRLAINSGQDWFDLAGGLDFGGTVVPVPEILAAARDREGLVRLGDGRVGLLPERWLSRLRALDLGEDRGEEGLRFRDTQAFLFEALFSERELEVEMEVDAGFRRLRERLDGFQKMAPIPEPEGFIGVLRPYQQVGLGWLKSLRNLGIGGCLADEMGLGKTVQVLAHLLAIRAEAAKEGRPALVVAPRSLAFQWIAEAARFTPELTILDHRGAGRIVSAKNFREHDIIVTTYGTLRRDAAKLSKMTFSTVVLDEATAIKNTASKTARAARLLRADHRVALTGTPVENHLGELWSLFEFLNPGMLGRASRFRTLLDPGEAGSAPEESATLENKEDVAAEHARFLEDVHNAVKPFLLRRHKEDVLKDLPPKNVETLFVELGDKQRAQYNQLRDHFRGELLTGSLDEEEPKTAAGGGVQVLEALLRLRQIACHPALLDPSRASEESAKLETLFTYIDIILDDPNRKVLIFSQFTSFLDLVKPGIEERDLDYELLTGKTRDREGRVQRFQEDPNCRIFLISLKAGGHGLNLTAADTVFLLDPWWNPAVEAQAIDRTHRRGQTRPVFAYRLIARGTVEEKVVALQEKKQALSDALLGPERSLLGGLSREDLETLLA
ncbi:MAG: superfamily II DNA or RNA helicase [Planctomycetota bacterium]|jgi:superfamily II DNA or RNA helicase